MRKPIDSLRMVLASTVGVAAGIAAAFVLARYGHVGWLDPLGWVPRLTHLPLAQLAWLVPLALLPVALAWVYATWFDGLLRGPSPVRGLKFGGIAWLWVAAIALLMHEAGARTLTMASALELGTVMAALLGAYGLGLGAAYGAGRRYDDYRCGLGYGIPDRRSIA